MLCKHRNFSIDTSKNKFMCKKCGTFFSRDDANRIMFPGVSDANVMARDLARQIREEIDNEILDELSKKDSRDFCCAPGCFNDIPFGQPGTCAHRSEELCHCGHPFYRHFDWADGYQPGCKYCECVVPVKEPKLMKLTDSWTSDDIREAVDKIGEEEPFCVCSNEIKKTWQHSSFCPRFKGYHCVCNLTSKVTGAHMEYCPLYVDGVPVSIWNCDTCEDVGLIEVAPFNSVPYVAKCPDCNQ